MDTLSGADFEPGVAQDWAHLLFSEIRSDGNLLKTDGEPPSPEASGSNLERVAASPNAKWLIRLACPRVVVAGFGPCSALNVLLSFPPGHECRCRKTACYVTKG